MATTRAKILRDFNDAGDGRSFTAGDVVTIETGAFANYEAAGLVGPAPKATRKAAPAPAPVPAQG